MTYDEVVVFVPSHSLEDFPTELGDRPAASLLNCFAVAFHPALLASTGNLPAWRRADDAPEVFERRLFLVPTPCDDRVPTGWIARARHEGAVVVAGLDERAELIEAVLGPLTPKATAEPAHPGDVGSSAASTAPHLDSPAPEPPQAPPIVDSDLVADFIALGFGWLQLELLTRHMHHFSSYDETFLRKTAVEAAHAALDQNIDHARDRLRACFDLLTEARERFYPVECYLIDLCLITPEQANEHLRNVLTGSTPVNYLLKARDAEQIAAKDPQITALLKEAWARGAADIIGGDDRELASPLVPLESTLHDLDQGLSTFRRLFGRQPTTWARRRYGLSPLLPQILQKFGYHSALHFLLDDGIYPDREQSKLRWDGCDNSSIDAYSRIPLAADAATTYLRLPQRLAETMQSDQVAALILARWPEVKCPFFHDLQRIAKYATVLGRAVTFHEYFQHSDMSGGSWGADGRDYLAPFLTQAVARREARPVSRYVQHFQRTAEFELAAWQISITNALLGREIDVTGESALRHQIEAAGPDVFELPAAEQAAANATADRTIEEFSQRAAQSLSHVILHGAGPQPGYLITNSLSFPRRAVIDLSAMSEPPKLEVPIKAIQFDAQRRLAAVEIPPAGFAWIPSAAGVADHKAASTALADGMLLQNEYFEVFISEITGGIQRIKQHGRAPNRLSQQLAFRFPREKIVRRVEGDQVDETKTWYSEMRCLSSHVTCGGPGLGEIETRGELIDPSNNEKLAEFQQTFRLWRGRPFLEIEILLTPTKTPEGDPWSNYYGSRFAWNDSTAALSCSLYGAAQPVGMERIESPYFLEIASDAERTTILPLGLPFHRKTGPRMIDSILIVDGETERRFRFVIGIDQSFPQQAALDHMIPVHVQRTETGPPRSGQTGWFYHIDSKCVQVTKLTALMPESTEPSDSGDDLPPEPLPTPQQPGKGFALRLQETEGRYQNVYVELFRRPSSGRIRDFRGRTLSDLPPSGDGVRVELGPFAIVDVEVRFD